MNGVCLMTICVVRTRLSKFVIKADDSLVKTEVIRRTYLYLYRNIVVQKFKTICNFSKAKTTISLCRRNSRHFKMLKKNAQASTSYRFSI